MSTFVNLGSPHNLKYFLIGIVLLYMGYPIASAASTSLFSKCLSTETQGNGISFNSSKLSREPNAVYYA